MFETSDTRSEELHVPQSPIPDMAQPPPKKVTFKDLSLGEYDRTERVERLRKAYFRACPEVCVERPHLVTRLHEELGIFGKERYTILDKARVYRRVLEEREAIVWHLQAKDKQGQAFTFEGDSLLAGSTTTKYKGVILYPEFMALALWPELHTMPRRAANPYQLTSKDAEILNREVFPCWLDRSILEWARADVERRGGPGEAKPDFSLLQYFVFFLATKPNCISHTIPDFSRAVREGLRAVIEEAQVRAARTTSEAQRTFYQAIAEALEGIITYSQNLSRKAAAMAAEEQDPARRRELETLAEIHRHVPEHPARTFREGITTVWLCWIACHLESSNAGLSLGRLDQLLYDLYRQDIARGAMTVDEAIELTCCLWLKIGDHVPTVPETGEQLFGGSGSNQAITIGGVDQDGRDAVNDLTYVMLRATELMQLRDPNLNARYMPGTNSREYLRRLCQANLHTGATPALHNDRAVIEALTGCGNTLAQARDYGVIGCVEPGSCGRHYGHSGALLLNLTSALELTLFNGRHRHTGLDRLISIETGDPATFRTFDDFRKAFERQVRWLVGEAIKVNNALGRTHQACYPTPILSALFEGPMDKGKDLVEGGAVINSSGVAIIGLGDTADSLSALQKVVYEERALNLPEMVQALEHDFVGYEALQARLMNPAKTPKWGNEDPTGDGNALWIVRLLDAVVRPQENYRGGHYQVGYWTMTNHAGFGRLMKALPSGRRAGESFTSGFTPVSGVTPNLTPALNSVASIPARYLTNGVAFNIKFTPDSPASPEDRLDRFTDVVEAYFHGRPGRGDDGEDGIPGGMEIQFNVTRREDFIEACHHPENYPELLVRVSGYTAYFKDLNKQMQQEIINRTEYLLGTGAATHPMPIDLRPQGVGANPDQEGAPC
jgi:formate C-acetyltransferase